VRNEHRVAEWLLRCVTPPHHAAALVGDLLEEDGRRRRLWFWTSVGRTAVALLWLNLFTLVRRMAGLRGLPDIMQPVTRLQYHIAGASVGLGLGLVLAFSRGPKRTRETPPAQAAS
jgi:hypothetical protein